MTAPRSLCKTLIVICIWVPTCMVTDGRRALVMCAAMLL